MKLCGIGLVLLCMVGCGQDHIPAGQPYRDRDGNVHQVNYDQYRDSPYWYMVEKDGKRVYLNGE